MTAGPEPAALRQEIVDLMQRPDFHLDDDAFNDLALRTFAFQFEHNAPYRNYCERRSRTPARVTHWLQVPPVPTAAFKEAALVSGDATKAQAIFRTSGTTLGPAKRGQHYVLDLELYEKSLLPAFRHYVLPAEETMSMVSLIPEWQSGGESSLGYMVRTVMRALGAADSWYAVAAAGIAYERLYHWLQFAITTNRPVCVLGTSLAFVHWFEQLQAHQISFQLPPGSRVMDTGGFKGSQRAVTSAELRTRYRELLGIAEQFVINEYGMTEMLSQYYDAHLRAPAARLLKQGPPWIRCAVVDPASLEPLPAGQTGLLRHFDLANLFSVSAIQTEDLGRAEAAGFEVLGRAAGATPRGCSIAMDLFLSAARS